MKTDKIKKCSKHKSRAAIFECQCGKRYCRTCAEENQFVKKYPGDIIYDDCLCGMFVEEC